MTKAHPDEDALAELGRLTGTGALSSMPIPLLLAIMDAVEAREQFPRSRSRNVAMYAVSTARALRLSPEAVEDIRLGAILANIGLLGVPEALLNKAGPLTPDEQTRVRHHPVQSADMLSRAPQLSNVVPIVLHHHEDWLGSGYPIGISGERIPIGARIVRICDTYDALTSDRPYRAAYPLAEALKALAAGSGRQFDPRLVATFSAMMRRQPVRDVVLDRWDSVQSSTRAWRVVAVTTTSLRR